jgi:delta-aminolevulinic acid dehydratase/porphobilinogen synthase
MRNFPTVDIRHFWKPIDCLQNGGIALNQYKWNGLQNVMEIIRDFVPELAPAVICEYTHHAQTGLLKCQECSPFIENDDMKEEANSKLIINK